MSQNNEKIVWITGGGSGIGAELTKVLVDNEYHVIISGRRVKELNKVKLYSKNKITVFKLDVSSELECKNVIKKIIQRFKKIDIAVLNAAAYNPGNLESVELSRIKEVMNVNLMGQINCLINILPNMRKRNNGQIVFVSSPAGFRGLPNSGIYGITKSGLTFLAETLRLELSKLKIKIQVVHPGFIKTPMTDKNKFPMPFLMTAKNAALRIYKGLLSSKFEIYFPKRLIIPMKFMSILPYSLYFFLMNKLLKDVVKIPEKITYE